MYFKLILTLGYRGRYKHIKKLAAWTEFTQKRKKLDIKSTWPWSIP